MKKPMPVTVVVRRRVRPGEEAAFEAAMQGFIRFALSFPGNQGVNVLRPAPGEAPLYTVMDRFSDIGSRREFKESVEYREWMARLLTLNQEAPEVEEIPGLGGWFTPPAVARPSNLKMAVVTFAGVLPLTAALPPLLGELLSGWHPQVVNVPVTLLIVVLLTWVVMPLLTRLLAPAPLPVMPQWSPVAKFGGYAIAGFSGCGCSVF